MSNLQSPITYPLLPFSRLVYDMTKWMPGVYSFPITYLWRGGANEKDRIEQAIRIAIANHPVFQMKVDWRGLHGAAPIKDLLHGRYHDVELSVRGNDIQISARFSRILGDGKSAEILLEDIRRAYEGLPLEPDDYWGYVARFEQHKYSSHYRISRDWLIKEFAEESVPVRPTIDRKTLFTVFPPKPGLFKADYSNLQEKIQSLSETHHLSMDGFFSLCTALAIAEYCDTDEAALTWAYEGRELPEEQRIFGSLHRDVPFKIKAKGRMDEWRKEELIKEARNQIRQGIAHSDYPYTLTAPYDKRWNYAVNVLRVPDLEYEQKYAYALFDVEIHEKTDELRLVYRYSATHYKESSIHKFAALVRKYVLWLID